mmetsp:Transcript_230/g.310  ORF Transcript_230/g.310 Transcript_230/m.310 type:complete len:217 (-) Transcript_230:65-715(-)
MATIRYKPGVWEGFYMLNGKKKTVAVNINFSSNHDGTGNMQGNGTDDILGFFNMDGKYNEKAPYALNFSFHFPSSNATMEFSGWREGDKGGFFGTWKGATGSGSFALAPSKEASDTAKKLEEQATKAVRTQLVSMGFPEYLIDAALEETKGLEPAVNWITQRLDNQGGPSTPGSDELNMEHLQQLMDMGFDPDMATQALLQNKTVEAAANWLFERM